MIVRAWIFVSPEGDDSAARDAPFVSREDAARRPLATLQAAIGRAGPAVAILLRAGEYRGNVEISGSMGRRDGERSALKSLGPDAPLVIAGVDGLDKNGVPKARLIGTTGRSTLAIFGVSHVKLHALEIEGKGSGRDEAPIKFIGAPGEVAPEHAAGWLEVRHCHLTGTGTDAIKVGKARHIRIVACSIDIDASESMIDFVSVLDSAVLDCEFTGSAMNGAGAKAASGRIVWKGNLFRYRGRRFGETGFSDGAIMVGGLGYSRRRRDMPENGWNVECFDSVARLNLFAGEFETAVTVMGAQSCLIERNFIAHRGAPDRPAKPLNAWRFETAESAPWRNQLRNWTAETGAAAPGHLGHAQNQSNVFLHNYFPPKENRLNGLLNADTAHNEENLVVENREAVEPHWRSLAGPIGPAGHDPHLIHELLGLPGPGAL